MPLLKDNTIFGTLLTLILMLLVALYYENKMSNMSYGCNQNDGGEFVEDENEIVEKESRSGTEKMVRAVGLTEKGPIIHEIPLSGISFLNPGSKYERLNYLSEDDVELIFDMSRKELEELSNLNSNDAIFGITIEGISEDGGIVDSTIGGAKDPAFAFFIENNCLSGYMEYINPNFALRRR